MSSQSTFLYYLYMTIREKEEFPTEIRFSRLEHMVNIYDSDVQNFTRVGLFYHRTLLLSTGTGY